MPESGRGGGGDGGGFVSRWSARKAQARRGAAVPVAVPGVAAQAIAPATAPTAALTDVQTNKPPAEAASPDPPPPPPTLADVALLTPQSDFSRFVAADVGADVRNAALKKLFADPHFNVMDRLDTYIDDYHNFEPLPKSMLRQMVQARVLGLLDDELQEQALPALAQVAPGAAGAPDEPVAELPAQPAADSDPR